MTELHLIKMDMSEDIDNAKTALRELIQSAVSAVDSDGLSEVVGKAVALDMAIASLVCDAAHVVEINRPKPELPEKIPTWLRQALDRCATEETAQVIARAYDAALETSGC